MSSAANPGAPHSLGAAIERLRSKWGAIVAFGALLMLMGVAALIFTLASTIALVTLNGVLFLIGGVAEIGVGMHAKAWGRFFWWVLGGAFYIFVGVMCLIDPVLVAGVLTLLLGAGLIAAGVVRAVLVFEMPAGRQRLMLFFSALATFLLGLIIVIHWPLSSVYVLGTLLGVDLLIHGAGWVTFGIGLRAAK